MRLKRFFYHFNSGPLSTPKELLQDWKMGNCRRAVQYYFLKLRNIFLKPKEVLCPRSYHKTGRFIFKKGDKINFNVLEPGDIVYAEKIRSKNNNLITFKNYLLSLHTALYIGKKGKEIWHATIIDGKSCYWSLAKFNKFYRPIAIKRIE